MEWSVIIPGFIIGATGSLHCVGMCGPLSLALPTYHLSKKAKLFSLLLYQTGRIITYSILGLLIGLAGTSIRITGYQQWFSITLGVIILTMAVLYFLQKKAIRLAFINHFYLLIQKWIGRLLKNNTHAVSFLLLGIANGLLPCGMVYIALATTLSLAKITESVLFMAMFGAGTLPAMLLVAYSAQFINKEVRQLFRKAVPVMITVMGLVLILRGLNLGIPFISPAFPHAQSTVIGCHS
jgi:sulfite exporter TauE/SafE